MIKILQGNCIDKIKELDDNSIDCVVSSPPYFGLRDYGVDGQFGLEKTYHDYLTNTVKVFETFKPKLKDTATIWWNVGDSYNQNQSAGDRVSKYSKKQKTNQGNLGFKIESQKNLKVKDLLMIPNRVAIALQDAGWYIRSEIIWHKPNPMPESVRDRPTSAHEKIWLITKNKKYYYDADAIREPCATKENRDYGIIRERKLNYKSKKNLNPKAYRIIEPEFRKEIIETRDLPKHDKLREYLSLNRKNKNITIDEIEKHFGNQAGHHWFEKNGSYPSKDDWLKLKKLLNFDDTYDKQLTTINIKSGLKQNHPLGRNKRNVWTVTTKPCKEAHFATFPKDLIEPCIKAGCQEGGVVLDPFGGSGTTGIVAALNNRNAILIELNQNYIDNANKRIDKEVGLFNENISSL